VAAEARRGWVSQRRKGPGLNMRQPFTEADVIGLGRQRQPRRRINRPRRRRRGSRPLASAAHHPRRQPRVMHPQVIGFLHLGEIT